MTDEMLLDRHGYGRFTVDVKDVGKFGLRLDHDRPHSVILMGLPKLHGWKPLPYSMHLSGQTSVEKVEDWLEENQNAREVAVLDCETGDWQTVWEGAFECGKMKDWFPKGSHGCASCRKKIPEHERWCKGCRQPDGIEECSCTQECEQ